MELIPVLSSSVPFIWDRVLPLIERACQKGPTQDLDPDDLRQCCIEGKHQLWIVASNSIQAVAITGILDDVCEWIVFASDDPDGWKEHVPAIEAWAASMGCTKMRSYSRPGMKRVMPEGYRIKGYIFEKVLGDGQ